MRRPAAAFLAGAALVAACTRAAPDFSGRWEGVTPERTRIAVNLRRSGPGWTGTLDLPDDRLLGKPLGPVEVRGDRVTVALPAHDGPLAFSAALAGDALAGIARRGTLAIPLRLKRAPAVPVPYDEEPIAFPSGPVTLHGAILRPRGPGPFPGVILVHGSSTPGRDDFRFFADAYARHGFIALIYDKRDTQGETNGGTASLETLAGDAAAAARALARRADVRGVGYWGFSQGGWIAPLAARFFPFRFVAVSSAPASGYAEVTRYADDRRLAREGFGPADRQAAAAAQAAVDAYVRRGGDPGPVARRIAAARATRWAARTTLPDHVPNAAERARFLRWIDLDFDPLPAWRAIRAPVFIAYGGADENVPAAKAAEAIARGLAGAGNRAVTLRGYPRANHNLVPAPTYMDDLIAWSRAAAEGPPPRQRLKSR
jgi:dienelactone hydrolase